jgi:hypothetical protein
MQLEKSHLVAVFVTSDVIGIASVLWLFRDHDFEPMIVSIGSITTLAGSAIALANHGRRSGIQGSPLTPDSPLLRNVIQGAMEAVCRGVSVPQTPESAALSAFIFKKEGDELICTHYWSPNPRKERVGLLRFGLRREVAERIVVVRAALDKEPSRTPVKPLPPNAEGVSGEVEESLKFVLAAPILNDDKSLWGVVDFDTENDIGKALLMNTVSDSVMHHLARHLRLIFSLAESRAQVETA